MSEENNYIQLKLNVACICIRLHSLFIFHDQLILTFGGGKSRLPPEFPCAHAENFPKIISLVVISVLRPFFLLSLRCMSD